MRVKHCCFLPCWPDKHTGEGASLYQLSPSPFQAVANHHRVGGTYKFMLYPCASWPTAFSSMEKTTVSGSCFTCTYYLWQLNDRVTKKKTGSTLITRKKNQIQTIALLQLATKGKGFFLTRHLEEISVQPMVSF